MNESDPVRSPDIRPKLMKLSVRMRYLLTGDDSGACIEDLCDRCLGDGWYEDIEGDHVYCQVCDGSGLKPVSH